MLTNSDYASLGLGSHVLYIYVRRCYDRSTERGARLEERRAAPCCSPSQARSSVEYARLITPDADTDFISVLTVTSYLLVHGTEIIF